MLRLTKLTRSPHPPCPDTIPTAQALWFNVILESGSYPKEQAALPSHATSIGPSGVTAADSVKMGFRQATCSCHGFVIVVVVVMCCGHPSPMERNHLVPSSCRSRTFVVQPAFTSDVKASLAAGVGDCPSVDDVEAANMTVEYRDCTFLGFGERHSLCLKLLTLLHQFAHPCALFCHPLSLRHFTPSMLCKHDELPVWILHRNYVAGLIQWSRSGIRRVEMSRLLV